MAFLLDEDSFVLTLMKAGKVAQVTYPNAFNMGFFVEGEETVNEINRRLKDNGFDVPAPKRNNHVYGFYVKTPGGFTAELGA